MARSRKKFPVIKDYSRSKQNGTRASKKFASKAVRNYKGIIPDGKAYKKLYCSWNISDYAFWYREGEGYWYVTTAEDVKRALRK